MKWTPLSPAFVDALRERLLAHYDRAARDLPWRRDSDPYRILVSEVMLQQTRVETVTRYYEPWLEQFPSVRALADADEGQVLKAWEGLGYYRRARNLHRAAQFVAESLDGVFPDDAGALRELPGVGAYTAGAVSSIAFGRVEPAVDGNVRRVFSRLFDIAEPQPSWLDRRARELVDPERPGDWNQALMEHGATVCMPKAPRCDTCPVSDLCAALAAGTVGERPAPPKRRSVPKRSIGLAVFHRGGEVLLQRRPPDGLLGGLWAFPEFEPVEARGSGADDDPRPDGLGQVERLAAAFGLAPEDPSPLPPVEHRFTHLEAHYLPVACRVEVVDHRPLEGSSELVWAGSHEREALALPVAQGAVFESWRHRMAEESE